MIWKISMNGLIMSDGWGLSRLFGESFFNVKNSQMRVTWNFVKIESDILQKI